MVDKLAEAVLARFAEAKQRRRTWESHWQDVADLVLPMRQFTVRRTGGQRITTRIFNSVAPLSAVTLASALHGLFVNTSIRWHELVDMANDTPLEGLDWLHDSTTRLLAYFNLPESGFPTSSYEIALDQVGFGTAIQQVVEPLTRNDLMRFIARRLVNFYLIEDESGRVFDVFRRAEMTATDVVRIFRLPRDHVPLEIKQDAADIKRSILKRDVIHEIRKRDQVDPLSPMVTNMPWASIYVDEKTRKVLRQGGFEQNPYLTPRWSKTPEEIYGRSPSIDMLPDIRMINAMTRTAIQAGELRARPPIAAIANSIEGNLTMRPGAFWWMKRGTTLKPEAVNTGDSPLAAREMIAMVAESIERGYFIDSLRLPTASRSPRQGQPRMTAEEVATRRMQGLLLASPVMSRQYSEWLQPAVLRAFHWMLRTGRLPRMPESMAGREITVAFTSPMAVAQRSSEARSFVDGIRDAADLAAIDPLVMKRNLRTNEAFRKILLVHNVDPSFLRPLSEVRQLEQQEAEAQQAMEQTAIAEQGGAAAAQFAGALKEASTAA